MSRLPSLLVALLLAAPAAADGPFTDLGYEAATAKAKEAGKLLMLDFTASWCPPCKMLEKQTWPDQKVIDWVAAHAIAIQVDVDVTGNKELAQKFGVRSIPTMVFLRDGTELARHTGFKSPADFVSWADAVLAGKIEAKDAAATASADAPPKDEVDKRRDAARDALRSGEYAVALEHYLWLWPNTREARGYGGVRLSFMLGEMAELAQQHEPAAKAFGEILDGLQRQVDEAGTPTFETWQEWSSMCQYFGQRSRVIAWYEARRDAEGRLFGGQPDSHLEGLIADEVFEVLIEARRSADAARLWVDTAAETERVKQEYARDLQMAGGLPGDMADQMREFHARACREKLAQLYAATLADGRPQDAAAVAATLIATLDDAESRMRLVSWTLALTEARPEVLAGWLDEAAADGADVGALRARLGEPAAAAAEPK